MKRLTVELSFSKSGRPVWDSIRILEWKDVKRSLKARAIVREAADRKMRKRRALRNGSLKGFRALRSHDSE